MRTNQIKIGEVYSTKHGDVKILERVKPTRFVIFVCERVNAPEGTYDGLLGLTANELSPLETK